jgi:hypothetical protein
MNAQPVDRMSTADIVAGFLAVVAIAAAFFSLAYRPVRVDVFAIILSFVAAGMADRNRRLAAIAVGITSACFIVGLVIAIVTNRPLF